MVRRCLVLLLLIAPLGCVERRYIITTSALGAPPGSPDLGAMVFNEKGLPLSASPADSQFVYYGKYKFTAIKDGYQTKIQEEHIKAPWYEWFLIDFVSENLLPWTIQDIRHVHITMEPVQAVPPEVLLEKANTLRERGQKEGPPLLGVAPPVPVPANSISNLPAMPAAK